MSKIFISYRRDDSDEAAGRLSDHLVSQFGQDNVFMDVDGIAPGRDFRKVIDETLTQCDVLLGVLGRNWVDAKDEHGNRRLDNESDFVRLEIGSALRRDIPVIPVRVQGAIVPKPDQLPSDLKDFAYRNSVELTHERWNSDVQVLVDKLRRLFNQESSGPQPAARQAAAATPPPPPPSYQPPVHAYQPAQAQPGGYQPGVAQAPMMTAPPYNPAPATAAPAKKSKVLQIVRWCIVGFFSLAVIGSFDPVEPKPGVAVFSAIVVIVFAWDPFKWFKNKS
jgi:hypothetical protein